MRPPLTLGLLALCLAVPAAAIAAPLGPWKVVKRGTLAGPGELAVVGSIVRQPVRIAFRASAPTSGAVSLVVVMSCRKGITTRVRRERLAGSVPFTRAVQLPLAGADNCAISATGVNPAGTLRLDLLRRG